MIKKAIAALSCLVIVGALWWASLDHGSASSAYRGDQLGMEAGESFAAYSARAQDSLAAATGDCFALVTFDQPGEIDALSHVHLRRVNAAVFLHRKPIPLPEPVGGATRTSVVQRWADGPVSSVVVYDSASALKQLANTSGIAAVEVLPSDAVWGRFGIRPVTPPNLSPH